MQSREDSWFWIFDDQGKFIVRSCYKWLQGAPGNSQPEFWKKLWSLKLPGKIKNFLWRVCVGCLPTVVALAGRGVNVETQCPWCHCSPETDLHVSFSCDFARTVWLSAGLQHLVQISVHDMAVDVIREAFSTGTTSQCVLIAMTCWSIWNRRNKWLWERVNGSVFGVQAAANNLLHDWQEAQAVRRANVAQVSVGGRKWKKPPLGWWTVNVDVAVFTNRSIGVACVIRDSQGLFKSARCRTLDGAWQAREAEAISLKEALTWVKELQLSHCIFQSDSKLLVNACKGMTGEAYFDTIVRDCVFLLKHINQVQLEFVYRSANSVAHCLAKATHSVSGLMEWHVTPPDFLSDVLQADII